MNQPQVDDEDEVLSKVKFTRIAAGEPIEDEGGVWEVLQIFYPCPCCGLETYVSNFHDGEGVEENIANGTVPPDVACDFGTGGIRLCPACERAAKIKH